MFQLFSQRRRACRCILTGLLGEGGDEGPSCRADGSFSHKEKNVAEAEKAVKDAERALNEAKKALNEAKERADKQAGPSTSDNGEGKVKTRWEYKALSHDEIKALEFNRRGMETAEGGLNMLGDEGWELVAIEPPVRGPASPLADRPALYVFKRPKK